MRGGDVRGQYSPAMSATPLPGLEEFEPSTAPLQDTAGRVLLSFSRIDTYRRCPQQFSYSYIDRLPRRPAPPLSFGTSIHRALEAFYARKLPQPPTVDELLQALYDAWDTSGFRGLDRDTQVHHYRFAQDVLRRFHAREAPRYRLPVSTEVWFELPLGDEAVVVGSIDRVDCDEDGTLAVVDYKTNRKVRDRSQVAGSLQLALYALACEHLYGRLPGRVTLDFVVAGLQVTVPLAELDLTAARASALATAAAIRRGEHPPTPSRWCTWCDFRSLCPAWDGDGPDVLGPATLEADRLRRTIARDVKALRQLEAGIARVQESDGAAAGR